MVVFYILGGILIAVVGVLGWLFYSLKRAAISSTGIKVEPVVHLNELKPFVPGGLEGKDPVPEIAVREVPSGLAPPVSPEEGNWQEEVRLAREKAVVLTRDFNDAISKIKKENEDLRADIEGLRQSNARLNNEELPHLKAECSAFKLQMDAGNMEISRLEAENSRLRSEKTPEPEKRDIEGAVRSQYQGRIDELIVQVKELQRDNELLRAPKAVLPEKVQGDPFSHAEAVDALRDDLEVLRSEKARMEARIEEMEEVARGEQEKSEHLSYELTKSRAHAVGVERICDNARRQFEGISREAHDTEHDNALLKRQSNALEQSLIDFKRLNCELLKREKLTQFELEHNRAQLKDLEHIYEVFRSRLQSAGVGEGASAELTVSSASPTKS